VPFPFGEQMKPTKPVSRFSQLSENRAKLVRLCQTLNFGSIQDFDVRGSEPVLDPPPRVLADWKLNAENNIRPEANLADFKLADEVRRLMGHFDELRSCRVQQIEVRAGVPRRIVFERVPQ
jgi:hypothetical protein